MNTLKNYSYQKHIQWAKKMLLPFSPLCVHRSTVLSHFATTDSGGDIKQIPNPFQRCTFPEYGPLPVGIARLLCSWMNDFRIQPKCNYICLKQFHFFDEKSKTDFHRSFFFFSTSSTKYMFSAFITEDSCLSLGQRQTFLSSSCLPKY